MGYRSDITIYMNKPALALFIEAMLQLSQEDLNEVLSEFKYADNVYTADNGDIVIIWTDNKWSYKRVGVKFIEDTVQRIGDDADSALGEVQPEVVMIRRGEEYDDVDHYESSTSCNPYGIYVRREIACDVSDLDPQKEKFFHELVGKETKENENDT